MNNKKYFIVTFVTLLLVGIILSILIMFYVNKKEKMICTKEISGVDYTFDSDYKGNKIEKTKFSFVMEIENLEKKYIDEIKNQDFCDSIRSILKDYSNSFTNCKQNVSTKELRVESEVNVNKISKKEFKNIKSLTKAKKGFKKQGYKCSIKNKK